MRLRKIIKTRGHVANGEAAAKLLWLALHNITAGSWPNASQCQSISAPNFGRFLLPFPLLHDCKLGGRTVIALRSKRPADWRSSFAVKRKSSVWPAVKLLPRQLQRQSGLVDSKHRKLNEFQLPTLCKEMLITIKLGEAMEGSTYIAKIAFLGDPATVHCVCDDCDWEGTADEFVPIGDCYLTPGDPSPAGRCPKCETLAYVSKTGFERENSIDLRDGVRSKQRLADSLWRHPCCNG